MKLDKIKSSLDQSLVTQRDSWVDLRVPANTAMYWPTIRTLAIKQPLKFESPRDLRAWFCKHASGILLPSPELATGFKNSIRFTFLMFDSFSKPPSSACSETTVVAEKTFDKLVQASLSRLSNLSTPPEYAPVLPS